jgi:DNA-directed RNA polymerase specialized sigma24 family protein
MTKRVGQVQGSSTWVQSQLSALGDENWTTRPECRELIEWLYTIVRHRAGGLGLPPYVRGDVAQDAMEPVVRALHRSRDRIAGADNPAAVLERIAARAVAAGRHRARMAGLAGVPANGQHWRAAFPRQVGGDAAVRVLDSLPVPDEEPCREVEDTARRLERWLFEHVGVALAPAAVDAVVYVLDRLVAGVSRAALVRGGHSGLALDPAMRHLGFESASASGFGCWLLGRQDAEHNAPSVLDAFLDGGAPERFVAERWRRQALKFGFAADADSAVSGAANVGDLRIA